MNVLGAGDCFQMTYELVMPPGWQKQSPKWRAEGREGPEAGACEAQIPALPQDQDKPCAESTQEKQNFIPVGLGDAL